MPYDSGRAASPTTQQLKAKTLQDMVECELAGPHEVHPSSWPPRANGMNTALPDMSLQCVKCGCNVVVYEHHAIDENSRIKVVMPGSRKVTA